MIRRHSNPLVLYIIQTHINVYTCTLKLTHTELSDIRHNISNTHTQTLRKGEGRLCCKRVCDRVGVRRERET